MELSQDWRSFRGVFYPHRRSGAARANARPAAAFVVVERGVVVTAYADHEDISAWVGQPLSRMREESPHRQVVELERKKVDEWLTGSLALPHFYDQIEHLRARADAVTNRAIGFKRHFLLEGLHGWWSKVLPSAYALLVRIESEPSKGILGRDLLLLVRRGAFEGFVEPDLTSLAPHKRQQPSEVVRFLADRYSVPVQALVVTAADWFQWTHEEQPWRDVARSLRKGRAKLVPFRWSLAALATTRAFFGV